MSDTTNVIFGSAEIYIAPLGTTVPNFTTITDPDFAFDTGWREVGYTDAGVELETSVTVKDIKVDELRAPVAKVIDEIKATLKSSLAESTLANMNDAIAAAVLNAPVAATGSHVGYRNLHVGGQQDLKYVMVALRGPAPGTGLKRVIVGYKALAEGNVTTPFKRTEKQVIPVSFGLIETTADGLYDLWDITTLPTT